jgi:acetolactate synthase-1/2/3 large subunit
MPSCGEALVGLLEQLGTPTVFGIPGVHTLEIYRGLSRSGLRHVAPRHEQGAAFMADAWARVTGQPGICVLISGPGLTNALTGIAQAHHDSIPMLVISGVVAEQDRGRGEIHDLPDQQALMSTVTAFSHSVTDPDELPEVLSRARAVFAAGRPRPVHIQVPVDVLARDVGELGALRPPPPRPRAAPASIERAATRLASAVQPLIILGGGARDAGPAALALAEHLAAPIGLTINARGSVDHDHELCLGSALSFAPVSDLLRAADAVVLVGAELSDLDLWGLDRPLELRGVIRVDIDEAQLHRRWRPAETLHGDAAQTLGELAAVLRRHTPAAVPERRSAAAAQVRDMLLRLAAPPELTRFEPLLRALERALPRERIVAGDSSQPVYAANHLLAAHRPRSWLMPIGYGCLGCALPMALGAKLAAPGRPVVALAGDGGFLFTLAELATACELGLAVPLVVYNNHGYGEIREAMDGAGIVHLGTDAEVHDITAIARGFGCAAARTDSLEELEVLLAGALDAEGPTVIELIER